MADPQIKFKRSSVALKRPTLDNVATGEFAINVYDGNLFTRVDTGGVGIATTVSNLTPWSENFGGESITYSGIQTIGGGTTTDYSSLTLSGLSPAGFNTTYTRQSTGFVLDTGTVASGNALFDTDSSYYYYVDSDNTNRMLIFSESDNSWMGVESPGTDYSSLTLDASISDLDGDYTRQSFKAKLDTGTASSGNALFDADSNYWWFLKDDDNSKIIIYDSVDGDWVYVGVNGADFSSAADDTALGSPNYTESQNLSSVQYEESANQPDKDYSEITYSGSTPLNFTSVSNNDSVNATVLANEQLVLSGMSDSNHNGTYDMVYRSGTRMLATVDQSGASIKISTQREAEYYLGISGTGISAIDNGGNLTVHKYTGYIRNISGDTWTWSTGSTGGTFHWYYFDATDDIFVAWDGTNSEWKAFDLGEATGNAASFISDLEDSGSSAGYLGSGDNFTLTSANIASLTSNKDIYPGTSIIRVPDGDDSKITYASASDHPYYVYQSSDAKKWILFSLESSYYWIAYYRSTAFDLRTETLTDDATAFTLDSTSDFEYITANSDTYNGNNVPDAGDSNVSYSAASAGTISTVTVTSGKTTADSRFVPTASGSIVYGTNSVGVTTSAVGVVTFTTSGNLILAGTVDGRDVASDGSNQDDLITLTGVGIGSTHFGTFTGTTISDNKNLKTVLQEIETAVDNVVGGNSGAASILVSSTDTDASFFPTFVGDNNASDTQEAFKTDAGITYNPSSNILTVSGSVAANVTGDLTGNVTGILTGNITGNVTGNINSTGVSTFTNRVDLKSSDGTPARLDFYCESNNAHYLRLQAPPHAQFSGNPTVVLPNSAGTLLLTDGSGASLTSLNASNISSGTISNDRLPSTITKDLTGDVTGDLTGNADTATAADTIKTISRSTNANHHITFVDSNNVSSTAENLYTDDGLVYNPSNNVLAGSGANFVAYYINGVQITSTAAELNVLDAATAGTAVGSKALVVDAARGIANLGVVTATTFSGNLTGNVTGNATGLSGSPSITVTDITAVGNVSIAGTLTYEDVTSVDALGIVTARTGVRVTTGGIVVSSGGINVTGVTTSTTFDGDLSGDVTGNLVGNVTGNLDGIVGGTTPAAVTGTTITANTGFVGDLTGDVTGTATTATNLADGANITTGTISNDRLPSTITKNLTGNVTGDLVGNVTGDVTGTATTATNLADASNITTGTISNDRLPSTITKDLTGDVTGDVTGNVSGNAGTATSLATARNIGGVSFDGTADINLPGVNASGNQDTTGNAGTATSLATARNIGGVSFDGTADINLPGVNATGNQDTTGNAGTATSLATSRTIHGVSFDGTSDIDLSEVIQDTVGTMFSGNTETGITVTYEDGDGTIDLVVGTLNQDTTGTAALAEGLTGTPNITVGVVTASSLDISGNVDIDGILEADAITIDGVTLSETIADTVGGMVTSNTETGITVTYDDSDNTLDFVIGTLNQDTTGNAGTATSLATARTIAGVSFDGTADISLNNNTITNGAGYITTSFTNTNQLTNGAGFITASDDITGNAATATQLETARNIGGVSFDGTGDINLPGVNATGNQNTSGTAAGLSGSPSITVTDITAVGNVSIAGTLTYEDVTSVDALGIVTARTGVRITTGGLVVSAGGADITGVTTSTSFDGDLSGNADTATQLETARNIGGVSFNGTSDINLPGVNATGNQDTTGNAGTATSLATARTIAGVSFDGTSDISLNNNAITNGAGYITTSFTNTNQLTNGAGFITASDDITGNAGTATSLATARSIAGVSFDGTSDISLNNNAITNGAGYITTSFTNTNQLTNGAGFITASDDITGNAGTATSLATSRTIAGVSFDGTADISLNNNAITNGAGYITTSITSYNDLSDTPTIPTNNNQLTNGAGYITTSFTNTNQLTNGAGFITSSDNITGTAAGLSGTPNLNVGVITATGGNFTGNVSFGDDDHLIFGDGDDLKIYHDGDHSYISDEGQGNLKLRSNAFKFTNVAESKTGLVVNPPTGVEIYYNNTKRLETLDGGVNVVGTCTATAFVGDGSGLTGIANTASINSDQIQVGVLTATSQFYPPSLTTSERDAITFSAGAFIFNSTEQRLQVYLGSAWASLTVDIDPYSIINM